MATDPKKKSKPSYLRPLTPREILRRAYKQAGALDALPKLRDRPSDVERLARAVGISEKVAQGLTFKEEQALEADLAIIAAGRISGTIPERLVAKWLLQQNVPYEGMGEAARLQRGFAFQVPLLGGRERSGGTVVDIYVSPDASRTEMGALVYPEGEYWHKMGDQPIKDKAKYEMLRAMGYEVHVMWDWEAETPGLLDAKMRQVLKL